MASEKPKACLSELLGHLIVGFFLLLSSQLTVCQELESISRWYEELSWVIQVSDLHVSKWIPGRAVDLQEHLGKAAALLQPQLVLITGDLTDAKNERRTMTSQDPWEWQTYRSAMSQVAALSGLPEDVFLDLRGNHDTYGVGPRGGPNDYHAKYSFSTTSQSILNATSAGHIGGKRVFSTVVTSVSGLRHAFVALDAAPELGFRGPCNFFGAPTDVLLYELEAELDRLDGVSSSTIVFGHYPLSFMASAPSGRRVEHVLASHPVSRYVCGHLHDRFGKQMHRWHPEGAQNSIQAAAPGFWEWEVGDWKDRRYMRLLVLTASDVVHVDVNLPLSLEAGAKGAHARRTRHQLRKATWDPSSGAPFLVIVSPSDARFAPPKQLQQPVEEIRTLVFSREVPAEVKAVIWDKEEPKTDEFGQDEVPLSLITKLRDSNVYAYAATWQPAKYAGADPSRFWLRLSVHFKDGRHFRSKEQPLAVTGEGGTGTAYLESTPLYRTTAEALLMDVSWTELYTPVLAAALGVLFIALFLLPGLVQLVGKSGAIRSGWGHSSGPFIIQSFRQGPWNRVWLTQMTYVVYLCFGPWFWGRVFDDPTTPRARFYLREWAVRPDSESPTRVVPLPDTLIIVLPFLATVLLPWIAWMAALMAYASLGGDASKADTAKEDVEGQGSHQCRDTAKGVLQSSESTSRLAIIAASTTQRRRSPAQEPEGALTLDPSGAADRLVKQRASRWRLRAWRGFLIGGALVQAAWTIRHFKRVAHAYGWLDVLSSPYLVGLLVVLSTALRTFAAHPSPIRVG